MIKPTRNAMLLLLATAAILWQMPLQADNSPHKLKVTGSGAYGIAGTTSDFVLKAKQKDDQPAGGEFSHSLIFQDLLVEFSGIVTCMAVDADEGRAWIGGVVTENNSEHPSFTEEIHAPGRDVWFRVLDTGKHAAEVDRTTFLGFEGSGGVITSEEYCELQLWPGPPDDEPNARTNALTEGQIKVKAGADSD